MKINPLKTRLANKQPCRGVWMSIPSPYTTRLLTRQPLDWLAVDCEHTPLDNHSMAHHVAIITDANGPAPIVRVAQLNVQNVKQALDAGAYGVIAPMVNTRAEAEQFVTWAKFPPQGQRSFVSFYAGLAFDVTFGEYLKVANDQTLTIVQIEHKSALDNLDGIFSVPGVDMAFIGPLDLSVSLGLDPVPENQHPVFLEAMDEIMQSAKKHDLPLGIFCSNGKAAAQRIEQGFLFVNVTGDIASLLGGVQRELEASQSK